MDCGPLDDESMISRIQPSLIPAFVDGDSYMARVSRGEMTNAKALHVLAQVERKLSGLHGKSETAMEIEEQVKVLIAEATDLRNLAQGESVSSFRLTYQDTCWDGCHIGERRAGPRERGGRTRNPSKMQCCTIVR